uniref:Uncharacterized protein n=1 Tax=Avena sativa TaxID=4498 RepID=A0ACD5U5A9_AVESA
MRGMPFAAERGSLLLLPQQQQPQEIIAKVSGAGFWEPTSVLDRRHSPSPSPPASTLSSDVATLAGGNSVSPPPHQPWPAGEDPGVKEEWAHQLAPLDMGMGLATGEGWDAATPTPGLAGPDSTFLRWIIGGGDDADPPVLELDHATSIMSPPATAFGPNLSSSFAQAMEDTKPAPFPHAPSFLLNQHQHHPEPHAAFFGAHTSFESAQPPPKRHHPMAAAPAPKLPPFPGPLAPAGGFLPALKPKAGAANDEAAAVVDQLAEAAKLAEAGDAFGAREILARLNYRLPAAPAAGTPLLRSAFYFKEALSLALSPNGDTPSPPASTPYEVVVKLGAYKAFSEVSPVLQFAHLTCVQAVLDELRGASCIHVLDFDIGMGEQWASLMQELAQRRPATALKVTALVSPASHHPLELQLIHENLSSFAAELGVFFQFTVFNIDTLDPADLVAIASGDALAVHLPVGAAHAAAMPAILRLVKRLGAKVVVAVDRGCDRTELPFAAHLFQAFQSTVFQLESLDAVGTDSDTASKIERFLIQPAVEQCVVGRHRASIEKAPTLPWRAVFSSAGFTPVQASTFAESQAESLLHKVPVRGFRVEKRAPGSLCLYWQRAELVSVSAWRC